MFVGITVQSSVDFFSVFFFHAYLYKVKCFIE